MSILSHLVWIITAAENIARHKEMLYLRQLTIHLKLLKICTSIYKVRNDEKFSSALWILFISRNKFKKKREEEKRKDEEPFLSLLL